MHRTISVLAVLLACWSLPSSASPVTPAPWKGDDGPAPAGSWAVADAGTGTPEVATSADGNDGDILKPRPDLRWMRRSAEYAVIARRIYLDAAVRLKHRIASGEMLLPWVVSMDADESILDNSQFEVESVRAGRTDFDYGEWRAWVVREEAKSVPGAVGFVQEVIARGGRVAVITNRDADQNAHTRNNLAKIGLSFPADRLCVLGRRDSDRQRNSPQEWEQFGYGNDKDRRRRLVRTGQAEDCWGESVPASERAAAETAWSLPHDIVMFAGDNIKDFPMLTQDAADSPALLDAIAANDTYILLPNPAYGSWRSRTGPRPR